MRKAATARSIVSALILCASACAARADVIDGEWCQEGSPRHFTIRGPTIVTPDGVSLEGTYSRHAFSYTVPSSTGPDGTAISMRLVNESTVHLREGADPSAPAQVWKRCQPVS